MDIGSSAGSNGNGNGSHIGGSGGDSSNGGSGGDSRVGDTGRDMGGDTGRGLTGDTGGGRGGDTGEGDFSHSERFRPEVGTLVYDRQKNRQGVVTTPAIPGRWIWLHFPDMPDRVWGALHRDLRPVDARTPLGSPPAAVDPTGSAL
ncbi:hypothetical protein ACN20G_10375 [Streptomyces sp. BI20]|uniref:hypothetical protein n=1 Tax=Streptomyces sp. BI20 TaxID=3403460 RepID=UPI003C72B903